MHVYAHWLVKIQSSKYFEAFIYQDLLNVLFQNQCVQMISPFLLDKKITFQLVISTDTPITLPEHQTQSSSIQGRLPDNDRPMENTYHRTSLSKGLQKFLQNNLPQI